MNSILQTTYQDLCFLLNIKWHNKRFAEVYFEASGDCKSMKHTLEKNICLASAGIIIRVLYAYWTMGYALTIGWWGSEIKLFLYASLIRLCKRSATNTTRRGDNGSPCLTPRRQWTVFPSIPLRSTYEVPEERIAVSHVINLIENPSFV
jgi:hypothetical protein